MTKPDKKMRIQRNAPLLSICVPTNGVVEWVMPTVGSVYRQGIDDSLFEIVVTDNGGGDSLGQALAPLAAEHANLVYAKTDSILFQNQIDCFGKASGVFVKFLNHRMALVPGALEYLLHYADDNRAYRPATFFSNGNLGDGAGDVFDDFDGYVRAMSYWSSWSGGLAFWREDFDRGRGAETYDRFFPHADILFGKRRGGYYVVDNARIMATTGQGHANKGRYDLFEAFANAYPTIIRRLYDNGDISRGTFEAVLDDNLTFVAQLYLDFVIRRKPCSYDLSSFGAQVGEFYSRHEVADRLFRVVFSKVRTKAVEFARTAVRQRYRSSLLGLGA